MNANAPAQVITSALLTDEALARVALIAYDAALGRNDDNSITVFGGDVHSGNETSRKVWHAVAGAIRDRILGEFQPLLDAIARERSATRDECYVHGVDADGLRCVCCDSIRESRVRYEHQRQAAVELAVVKGLLR